MSLLQKWIGSIHTHFGMIDVLAPHYTIIKQKILQANFVINKIKSTDFLERKTYDYPYRSV